MARLSCIISNWTLDSFDLKWAAMSYFKSCSRRKRTRTRDLEAWVALLPQTGLYPLFSYLDGKARSIKNCLSAIPLEFNSLNHQDISNNCRCASPMCDNLFYRCWTRCLVFELPFWGLHVVPFALPKLARSSAFLMKEYAPRSLLATNAFIAFEDVVGST